MNEPGTFSTFLSAHVEHISLYIGMICTLGLYSVLYKENKVFRFFEHLFLGLATGYMIQITWNEVLLPKWWMPMTGEGQWWWVFALAVGSLFYCIYSKKLNWMARIVIGLFLGQQAGMQFQAYVNDAWPQIIRSFRPVLPHGAIAVPGAARTIPALSGVDAINNLIFMIILLCVMSYFFFSFEQKHAVLKYTAKSGRWLMMFTFGAIFGSTVMARLALLIDRMDYLLNDFGGREIVDKDVGPKVMLAVLLLLTIGLALYGIIKGGPESGDGGAQEPAAETG